MPSQSFQNFKDKRCAYTSIPFENFQIGIFKLLLLKGLGVTPDPPCLTFGNIIKCFDAMFDRTMY